MGHLYKIDFPSGKSYIGITSRTAEHRFSEHAVDALEKNSTHIIHNAIRKYGVSACEIVTLATEDDWATLCQMEKIAIKQFNSKSPNGYNMTDGGDGSVGLKWNEAQRNRMSEVLIGNTRAQGCEHTLDGIRRIKESLIGNKRAVGNKHTPEGNARISAAQQGTSWGSPKTLEHRIRISVGQAMRRARELDLPHSVISEKVIKFKHLNIRSEFT